MGICGKSHRLKTISCMFLHRRAAYVGFSHGRKKIRRKRRKMETGMTTLKGAFFVHGFTGDAEESGKTAKKREALVSTGFGRRIDSRLNFDENGAGRSVSRVL